MVRTRSRLPQRLLNLALALVVAFVGVATVTLVASAATAHAAGVAGAPAVCEGVDQISITLPDGSTKCVENTCEAVMGAEGRADECTKQSTRIDTSVPAAGETGSGVAPVREPVIRTSAGTSGATANANQGDSTGALVWILGAIGLAALLAVTGYLVAGRLRARRDERTPAR